jgi:hypothetical protein
MRKLVGIALVLGATFVSMMAVPNNPRTEIMANNQIHREMTGLKVPLPSNFPVELVH